MRKVRRHELAGYAAWGSGIRRDESPTRAGTRLVDWDAKRGMVKINPRRLDADERRRLRHRAPGAGQPAVRDRLRLDRLCALHPRGGPGEDERARWAGKNKIECGLHE